MRFIKKPVLMLVLVLGCEAWAEGDGGASELRSAIFIKGGVGHLNSGAMAAEMTPWSPVYGAGFMFQPATFFGLDLIYEGGRNEFAGPLTDATGAHAALWKHGASALLKFGLPIGSVVYPYVGAGAGVDWFVPTGPTKAGLPTDMLLEVPLAAGIDLRSHNFLVGLRFTYRFLIDQWFARTPTERDDSGASMDLQLILAMRF